MTAQRTARETLLELLATRSTEGLRPTEDARLATLLHAEPDLDQAHYDLAATGIDLAVDAAVEALPRELELSLVASGHSYLMNRGGGAGGAVDRETPRAHNVVSFRRDNRSGVLSESRRGLDWARWAGWVVAAALAGFTIGLRFLTPPSAPPATERVGTTAQRSPTVTARRARLVATAPDLRRVTWSATDHPLGSGVEGEVIWSDRSQEGYMTFRGLAWNDPTQRQYQLWVFDSRRSDERPVDGGVFDIPASSGEVVIPIDPKLRVDEATLFAITLERPGGVVVSSRKDLLLIAPVT